MALKKDVILNTGLEVAGAYHTISNINGSKNGLEIILMTYLSQEKYLEGKSALLGRGYSFTPSVAEDSENFIKQGYEYLKTLPEYIDSIDC